jgi:hypothetical protein
MRECLESRKIEWGSVYFSFLEVLLLDWIRFEVYNIYMCNIILAL